MPREAWLLLAVIVVGAALVVELVNRWRARRRARIAQDHSASSFLFGLPRCQCDACKAWRRIWGGGRG